MVAMSVVGFWFQRIVMAALAFDFGMMKGQWRFLVGRRWRWLLME